MLCRLCRDKQTWRLCARVGLGLSPRPMRSAGLCPAQWPQLVGARPPSCAHPGWVPGAVGDGQDPVGRRDRTVSGRRGMCVHLVAGVGSGEAVSRQMRTGHTGPGQGEGGLRTHSPGAWRKLRAQLWAPGSLDVQRGRRTRLEGQAAGLDGSSARLAPHLPWAGHAGQTVVQSAGRDTGLSGGDASGSSRRWGLLAPWP